MEGADGEFLREVAKGPPVMAAVLDSISFPWSASTTESGLEVRAKPW